MTHRLIDVILRSTLLAVPLAGCPCPNPHHSVDTTVQRSEFGFQIDTCLSDDSACEALCRAVLDVPMETTIESCKITAVRPAEVDLSASLNTAAQCVGGRRPDGFIEPRCTPRRAGAWVAHTAMLEAASVTAFARLVRALVQHGAPRTLIAQARRAIADELLHARLTARLARRLGGTVAAPVIAARVEVTLAELAIENAVEGQVGETFGALVASCQARAAGDAEVRAVNAVIARDETRHAALAHGIAGWLDGKLPRRTQAQVAAARASATEKLLSDDLAAGLDREDRTLLGLPDASRFTPAARAMFAAL